MVKIGDVWDRTVEGLGGRAGMLASIALLLLFLPTVVRDAANLILAENPAAAPVKGTLGIALFLAMIWGTLALTAVASDPATDRAQALRRGAAALPSTILTILVLLIVFAILFAPGFYLLARSGFDFAAAAADRPQTHLVPGTFGAFSLYALVYGVFMIWAAARLALLYPVLVNERLGLGSIARAFALTRGLTWKIIGVLILYGLVLLVVLTAATVVLGLIFRLLLGSDNAALVSFLVAAVGSAVTAFFGVLQPVFAAQLYIAARRAHEDVSTAA